MQKQPKIFPIFSRQLEDISHEMEQNPPSRIGYRERVRIERPLFLIAKEVCLQKLGFELHGLTEVHRKKLFEIMEEHQCSNEVRNFIQQVFELRVFVLQLSSSNPYVQENALSRVSVTQSESVEFLIRKLRSLAIKGLAIGV